MGEKWEEKELELNHKHEEILRRREALMAGCESYYDCELKKSASFLADIGKAMTRNSRLIEEMNLTFDQLKRDSRDSSKLSMIKNNYWTMVRNVFPVWYSELSEYEARKQQSPSKAVSPVRTTNVQQLPTNTNYSNNSAKQSNKQKKQSSPHETKLSHSTEPQLRFKSSSTENLSHRAANDLENSQRSRSKTKTQRTGSFQSLPRKI